MQKDIGARLRLFRQLREMTQVEAAQRIDVTKEHVSQVERGCCCPSFDMLFKAARAYDTDLVNFFLFPEADRREARAKCPADIRLANGCGVWTLNLASGVHRWSEAMRRMLGYRSREKPSFDALLRLVQRDEIPGLKRFMAKISERRRPRPLACGIIRDDGLARRLLIQAEQLEDESDQPDLARLVILDITDWTDFRNRLARHQEQLQDIVDRKTRALAQSVADFQKELNLRVAAEQEARRHREKLELILSVVPAVLYSFSATRGDTEWHSPHMHKALGISLEELREDPMLWHDSIHPEDQPLVHDAIRLAQEGHPIDVEYRIKGRDGQWRWLHDRATPFQNETSGFCLAGVVVNVTERRRIEEDLRESREMFQAVAEDIPALLCRYAPGCIIAYVNEAYCRCFGKTRAELIGACFLELMPEAARAHFLAALAALTPDNPTVRTEHEVLDAAGQIRWHRWTDRAIFNSRGQAVACQSIGEDITEQKRTREALGKSEQLYRSIFARSPIAIELYDAKGRLLEVNPACLELFGVLDGRDLQGFDLFADPNLKVEDIASLKRGATVCFEAEFDFEKVRRDNLYRTSRTGTIWLSVLITPLGDHGANGYLAQIQDITERKKSRERLLEQRTRLVNILKGTNVGTWEWNVQTGATVFNERWAEIVGYELEELAPVCIATWTRLVHPEDLSACETLLQRHFHGEIDYYECEARMRHKDGHWVWVLVNGRVITWTEDGKPLWMFGTHQDITSRKMAEMKAKEAGWPPAS